MEEVEDKIAKLKLSDESNYNEFWNHSKVIVQQWEGVQHELESRFKLISDEIELLYIKFNLQRPNEYLMKPLRNQNSIV